jgi:hypothetical protein
MIIIANGIQNHTVAIAAPVTMEAAGTTPMLRGLVTVALIAAMPSTYELCAPGDTAFSPEPGGG